MALPQEVQLLEVPEPSPQQVLESLLELAQEQAMVLGRRV